MSAALPAWPQLPAVYGWLALDRRGRWRLRGEPVVHGGLIDFLNRHYEAGADGAWFVRNGPQRVFVDLDYAPLVLRLQPDGGLIAHTGRAAGTVSAVVVDDEGNVAVATAAGPGLLDDRDLAAFVDKCCDADGGPVEAEALLAVADGATVRWHGVDLRAAARADLPALLGFVPQPTA